MPLYVIKSEIRTIIGAENEKAALKHFEENRGDIVETEIDVVNPSIQKVKNVSQIPKEWLEQPENSYVWATDEYESTVGIATLENILQHEKIAYDNKFKVDKLVSQIKDLGYTVSVKKNVSKKK